MNALRVLLLAAIALVVVAFFFFDLGDHLTLEGFKALHARLEAQVAANRVAAAVAFFGVYVVVTGLSLPGAGILTIAGGALFGLLVGVVLVSFASVIGATIAFLASRFVLRDAVQSRFGDRLATINEGVEREGGFYLFALRLVPLFPFFVVNLVMGLTPIRTWTYAWVSQLAMLPATAVFVNAGRELGQLESLSGILSPGLIASFVLLAIFPFIARRLLDLVKARRAYRGYEKPSSFDRDMVVIGAGAAGLVSSYIAATVRSRVTLVEHNLMGGDCLNYGCVPSKALIRSAKVLSDIKHSERYGIAEAGARYEFEDIMARIREVIAAIAPHDSVERYTSLGVECIDGYARIKSPFEVEIDGKVLTTRSIVIATGAEAFIPPIPGIGDSGYVTSDTLWDMRELPERMLVLGGGPIGCELAQCFARLGSKVTQVEMAPRLLVREDPMISSTLHDALVADGVDVLLDHKAVGFERDGDARVCVVEHDGEMRRIPYDVVLVAVGRKARTTGFGLEELGIETARGGTVAVNEYLQTRFPNIYACGDVAGPYQFTHVAAHQAWFASVNALFGTFRRFRADYSVIPWVTFTDPEIARCGINETEAKERGIDYEVTEYGIDDLDRAIADSAAHGVVRVITPRAKDRILGVTIVGHHAGEIIAEYVLAMRYKLGLNKILGTIHSYPTMAEANKYAAGEWKKAHKPEKLLDLVAKYHSFRRGEGFTSGEGEFPPPLEEARR